MDIILNQIISFKFRLENNFNDNIFYKTIKIIKKKNNFIKINKIFNNTLKNYINFTIKENFLYISFSHLYYDAYSIFYVLSLIDDLYIKLLLNKYNDIEKINIKIINNKDTNNFELNNYLLLVKMLYNNRNYVLNYITNLIHNQKKIYYLKKYKFMINNKISTILVIDYLIKKFNIKEFNIFINARKVFKNKEFELNNYIYTSDIITNSKNIYKLLENDSKKNYNELKNNSKFPPYQINSYLSFKLPSFISELIIDHNFFTSFIFPTKDSHDYIKVYI